MRIILPKGISVLFQLTRLNIHTQIYHIHDISFHIIGTIKVRCIVKISEVVMWLLHTLKMKINWIPHVAQHATVFDKFRFGDVSMSQWIGLSYVQVRAGYQAKLSPSHYPNMCWLIDWTYRKQPPNFNCQLLQHKDLEFKVIYNVHNCVLQHACVSDSC